MAVGVALAGVILTATRGLRQDMARLETRLREDISQLREDMKQLSERVARVEHSQAKLEGCWKDCAKPSAGGPRSARDRFAEEGEQTMKTVWTAFVAATAIQAFGDVATYQLPRSLGPMPVLALVECLDDGPDGLGCKVSQYCGSPDDWDAGVSIDTFDDIGTVAKGGLKWWPPYSANEQGDVIVGSLDANRLAGRR